MPRDGRYVTMSQGWRCDECPGMDGMSQRARDGGATNAQGWAVCRKEPQKAVR